MEVKMESDFFTGLDLVKTNKMVFPLNNPNFRKVENPSRISELFVNSKIPILKDSFEEKEQIIGWTVGNPKIKNDGIYADIMIKSDYSIDYVFSDCSYQYNKDYEDYYNITVMCLYFKKGENNESI